MCQEKCDIPAFELLHSAEKAWAPAAAALLSYLGSCKMSLQSRLASVRVGTEVLGLMPSLHSSRHI